MKSPIRIPLAIVAVVCAAGLLSATPAIADTEGPGWELFPNAYPTHFIRGVDAVQTVVPNEEGKSFTLTFEGEQTPAIPAGASGATVQAALEGLAKVGKEDVAVAEDSAQAGAYSVTFTQALGNMKVAPLEGANATASVAVEGSSSGTIGVDVFNIGAGASHGTITVTDTLPPGVKAKEAGQLLAPGEHFGIDPIILHGVWDCTGNGPGIGEGVAGATVVTCTNDPIGLNVFDGGGGVPVFAPNENVANPQPVVGIAVEATTEASGLKNRVSIAGGGAAVPVSVEQLLSGSPTPGRGGITQADAWLSSSDGTIDTQAGSHPYTAAFVFNTETGLNAEHEGYIVGSELRSVETRVPPGLVGDLHAMPQCTHPQLLASECPPASMVGILATHTLTAGQVEKQLFNMVPPTGEPAEVGFEYAGNLAFISFAVQTGGDYAIVAHADNVPRKETYETDLILWGVPQEQSHDRWRGGLGGCTPEQIERQTPGFGADYCLEQQNPVVTPFLTLPTSCGEPEPQSFAFRELGGWQEPGATSEVAFPSHDADGDPAGFTGCESLNFEPSIRTSPDTAKSDTPAGLTVEVKPPLAGLEAAFGLSSADIENTTVTLPPGFVINPGQAAGLQACQPGDEEGGDDLPLPGENGEEERFQGPAKCPNASKIGTVMIKSPLLEGDQEKELEGDVYVLQSDPPELKLLVAASADGVNLKLVGTTFLCETVGEVLAGKSCEAPGQIIASFANTPQLPFTVFKLSFSGGAQAALDTPAQCGTYTSNADFMPWSSPFIPDFDTSASFSLTEGPDGTACPSSPMPFAPSMTAGATTDQAGGFTSFSMLLQRGDGQQRIEKLSFQAPEGLSGMISQVPLCGEAQANAGTCPASSHIGHAVVTSGPGAYPLVVPQPGEPEAPIYLTGPYKGEPFGLSIVTPVIAGPFNLGTIVTRASIGVDPRTAQITVTTDPLPQIVKGVPTDLREIQAVIDRPGFMFNPTSCSPQAFSGVATSVSGTATAAVGTHFQVGSCQSLKFEPKFAVGIPGHASKMLGAGLTAKLSYPAVAEGTDANIAKVKVDLPVQLPSQLKTLQKACVAATFEANPAGCPEQSIVGHATVTTPLLPVPLTGPAYFVSHAGAEFPSLTVVLQGYGVTIDLVGSTFISKAGVTSTTFNTVPDVPFNTFQLTLPQGKYSALGVNLPPQDHYSYCGLKLAMPTAFTAQDGTEIHESTPISIEGCPSSLTIQTRTINKKTLTLTVYAPAAGKLTATAKGLTSQTKTAKGRENLTFTLNQTKAGKLKTTARVSFKPTKGKGQAKSTNLKFTK